MLLIGVEQGAYSIKTGVGGVKFENPLPWRLVLREINNREIISRCPLTKIIRQSAKREIRAK